MPRAPPPPALSLPSKKACRALVEAVWLKVQLFKLLALLSKAVLDLGQQ